MCQDSSSSKPTLPGSSSSTVTPEWRANISFIRLPLTDVRGVAAAQRTEGLFSLDVDVAAGDRFEGLRSSWDRIGDLIVDADTPAEALRLAEKAAAMIEIDVQRT
jgi:hypothetical protein